MFWHRMLTRRTTVLSAVTAVTVASTIIGALAISATATGRALDLRFDSASALTSASGSAAASVAVSVVSAGGGRITTVAGRAGQGNALAFPEGSGNAILALTPASGSALAPGTANFSFGADVRPAGRWSDGDNVVQRGLADDRGQYKLQIDAGRAWCVVKGSSGTVSVMSSLQLTKGVWYRLDCARDTSGVTLRVTRIDTGATTTTRKAGATGDVRTSLTRAPLSVGGKLTKEGKLATWQPDQFHGLIDNVTLQIG